MSNSDERLYLYAGGILSSAEGEREIDAGRAMPLAGGPAAFSLLDVIRRQGPEITRRTVRVTDRASLERLVGIDALRRLTEPRPPLAGLVLDRPRIMGVLNVTPDSFSDGGQFSNANQAIEAAISMAEAGADIIDVGGESTRPGAAPVSVDEELSRVLPIIEGLVRAGIGPISIDSRKAKVLQAARAAGAHIFNDVSALAYDPESVTAAANAQAHVVLMHAQGEPRTMQDDPAYENVLLDVFDVLEARVRVAEKHGITRDMIVVDPGIGFGKTLNHNLSLLNGLSLFHGLGCAILLGASRKRFIAALDRDASADARLGGSLAAVTAGLARGVHLYRVHDVAETRQTVAVFSAISAAAND